MLHYSPISIESNSSDQIINPMRATLCGTSSTPTSLLCFEQDGGTGNYCIGRMIAMNTGNDYVVVGGAGGVEQRITVASAYRVDKFERVTVSVLTTRPNQMKNNFDASCSTTNQDKVKVFHGKYFFEADVSDIVLSTETVDSLKSVNCIVPFQRRECKRSHYLETLQNNDEEKESKYRLVEKLNDPCELCATYTSDDDLVRLNCGKKICYHCFKSVNKPNCPFCTRPFPLCPISNRKLV